MFRCGLFPVRNVLASSLICIRLFCPSLFFSLCLSADVNPAFKRPLLLALQEYTLTSPGHCENFLMLFKFEWHASIVLCVFQVPLIHKRLVTKNVLWTVPCIQYISYTYAVVFYKANSHVSASEMLYRHQSVHKRLYAF